MLSVYEGDHLTLLNVYKAFVRVYRFLPPFLYPSILTYDICTQRMYA